LESSELSSGIFGALPAHRSFAKAVEEISFSYGKLVYVIIFPGIALALTP
jgi:hypothetical protein